MALQWAHLLDLCKPISLNAISKRSGFLITSVVLLFGFDTLMILSLSVFDSKNNALQFLQYLNSCQVNIKFTIESEEKM